MSKAQLIKGNNGDYRYKLPFSALCNLRDEGIDFFEIDNIIEYIYQEPRRLYPIMKEGLEVGEKREIDKEELENIVDDIMETIGWDVGIYILDAVAIYSAPQEKENTESKLIDLDKEEKK